MTQKDFCKEVIKNLHNVTKSERAEIYKELTNHIEDSTLDLIDAGYLEADAKTLALSAMGEPQEIAKEFQKAYSPFWLWALRLSKLVLYPLIVLVITLLPGFYIESSHPKHNTSKQPKYYDVVASVNEKIDFGDNRIYIGDIYKVKNTIYGENKEGYDYLEPDKYNTTVDFYLEKKNLFSAKYFYYRVNMTYETDTLKKQESYYGFSEGECYILLNPQDTFVTFYFNLEGTDITAQKTVKFKEQNNGKN